MDHTSFLDEIKRLNALADIGLLYNQNEYDRERYAEIKNISLSLLQQLTDHPIETLKQTFPAAADYPTVKVDVRALTLSPDNKILLIKERADGKWSLPGGWADIGQSPKEVAAKEVLEETGLKVEVKALIAVFDKRLHPHPPQPFYVYKFVFYCEAVGGQLQKAFDVLDVTYFNIDQLPELSEDRILKSQIESVYQKIKAQDFVAYFD